MEGGWTLEWWEEVEANVRKEAAQKERQKTSETDEERAIRHARQERMAAERANVATQYGNVLRLEVELKVGQFTRWLDGVTVEDFELREHA